MAAAAIGPAYALACSTALAVDQARSTVAVHARSCVSAPPQWGWSRWRWRPARCQLAIPTGDKFARVSPGAAFWLLLFALALVATDALARLRPGPLARVAALVVAAAAVGCCLLRAPGTICR